MKILDIIRDANANLFRNKLRSFLTILAIFIGSFAIITNTAIQAGVNRFIDDQVDSYGGEGYIAIANKDTLDVMMNSTMRSSKEPQEYSADQNQTSATPITMRMGWSIPSRSTRMVLWEMESRSTVPSLSRWAQ